jgi:DNA mismatch repair protein MutL
MKTKIRVLSEKIINQIAAGEVVENPSAALKELIENAIDAGAGKIWVEVQGGGFTKFTVADDGEGMSRDDALLAFERHATSKVFAYEDLLSLRTMGFRGEALSSISAVSKVSLLTSDGEEGTLIEMIGGKLVKCEGAGRQRGTTITVNSLFFNTPARKKFQVSSSASQSAIVRMIQKAAFAYPDVHFSFKCGDKEVISLPHDTLLKGMRGREVEVAEGEMRLSGVIGEPSEARGNRSGQFIVINHRVVESFEISEAVKEGFGTRLGMREFPCFALHLFLPPEEVDVNVHPQKLRVRFSEVEKITTFIREAVQKAFIPSPKLEPSRAFSELKRESWNQSSFILRDKQEPSLPVIRNELNLEEMDPIGVFAHFLILRGEELLLMHLPRVQQTLMESTSQKGVRYRFSFEEAKGMLQVLKKRPNQETSPEGKPLFVRLSQHAINTLFI